VPLQAIQAFQYPVRDELALSQDGAREQFGDLLTILINPTLTDVFRECRDNRYTHVGLDTDRAEGIQRACASTGA
jgi:hypothetical protein